MYVALQSQVHFFNFWGERELLLTISSQAGAKGVNIDCLSQPTIGVVSCPDHVYTAVKFCGGLRQWYGNETRN